MMRFEEYRRHDATALAAAVRQGEVTPTELLEIAIARAEQVNPAINAIITPMYAGARHYVRSRTLSGRFAGVPILLKDLLAAFAHVPLSNGSRLYRYQVPGHHSTLVQRLVDQGMVIVGKTNTPELGLLATTENRAFGATRNPWQLDRMAGGSSGGTAAAVAAGIVPLGSAGDGGGSIRIPASCCGLFGLKPTRGLVPAGPEWAQVWDGAVCEHVITRSVRDSAALLDILAGPDPASHTCVLPDPAGYAQALAQPMPRLRIGFCTHSPLGGVVQAECREVVEQVARMLAQAGHQVEEAAPSGIEPERLVHAYADIYLAHVSADVAIAREQYGARLVRRELEPLTQFLAHVGARFSAADHVRSLQYWPLLRQQMAAFHARFDLWMTPVLAAPPARLGEMRSSRFQEIGMQLLNHSGLHRWVPRQLYYEMTRQQMQKVPFTQIANITGQPAMSVPLGWSRDGLPIGVQFMGALHAERTLLQLAHQLETAMPWFDRVPML